MLGTRSLMLVGRHRRRNLLRRHQGREVGVGARHHGEDRGVDDAQALHALDPSLGVDDRHRIVRPAHAAGAGGMPHADRRLAHEGFERLVVVHHLVEGEALDHELVDHVAAQRRRPVEHLRHDAGQDLVLGVDHADRPHLVAVGGGEGRVGHLAHRVGHLQRGHQLEAAHQPVDVALVRQEVELDDRLAAIVARGELDLSGLRVGLVDEGEQRADLLAHRMPGRLGDDHGEHVAHRDAGQLRGIAQAQMDVPARVLVHARAAAHERRQRDRGMVHQPLADAGQGGDHRDAHLAEMADRADAGAHQMGRRMDGARRQDHFLGPELLLLAARSWR